MKINIHTMKNNTFDGFNKACIFFTLLILSFNHSKACSPLQVPTLNSQAISGNFLNLTWSSNTIYNCTYSIQVEIACSPGGFTGVAPFYVNAGVTKTSTTPYPYPGTQAIDISNFCPGTTYSFRAREVYGTSTFSGWTSTFNFTTPGTFIPPSGTIIATPPTILACPAGNSQLSFSCSNCCGIPPYSYTWAPGSSLSCTTCASPIATPSITTIYTLNVNGGKLGCWGFTNTVQVTVINTPPVVGTAAVTPGVMCAGNTATLTITTYSGSIQWQSSSSASGPWTNLPGATSGTFVTAPLTSTTYFQAYITGCGGPLASNVVNVVVNPSPTVTVNSTSICAGQTANLTANGAASYVWTAGATSTGPNTASANPMTTTSYTVTGTTAGCTGSAVATVSVNPMPVPTANNNGPICTGAALNLTSTGGGTYSWTGPAFASALQNPVISPAALSNAGTYIVTVNLAGCTATAQTNVSIFTPTASASNTGPYCAGSTVQLNASIGASYTWSGPGFAGVGQNPTIPNAAATATGVYTVVINLGSCTATATTAVTVYALPTPLISNNTPVCIGNPINFTGGGGVSYSWNGPNHSSNAQNPTIASSNLTHNGTHTLTVTDVNNCTNTITTLVIVNPQPIVSATGATVCENSNATLTSNGGTSYSWSGPGGYTSNVQNPNFPNAVPSNSGMYTVLVTDANTCTNTAVANLLVNPAPVANIVTNSPICIDHVLSLNGSGGATYSWSGPNGFFSSVQSPSIMASTIGYTGNYALTVTDASGCTASAVAAVVVNPIPNITIAANKNASCPPLCTQFSFGSSSPVQFYNWQLGNGVAGGTSTVETCYTASGIYTVNASVTDIYGCSNSGTYTVEVYPKPVADFNYAPIKPVELIEQVTFTDASHSANIITWNWYFMNTAQYTSVMQNPTFIYEQAGEYPIALIVKSDKGCSDTLIKKIVVIEDYGIYVPNAFTPNGDGVNDIFQPKGFGVVKYEMNIFDRWGEKVFSTNQFEKGWDGTKQAKHDVKYGSIEEGVYTWLINLTNVYGKSHELKGHVTLMK
jgi:gliding motility-associated-like protein